jgi:hypothetical protein
MQHLYFFQTIVFHKIIFKNNLNNNLKEQYLKKRS